MAVFVTLTQKTKDEKGQKVGKTKIQEDTLSFPLRLFTIEKTYFALILRF